MFKTIGLLETKVHFHKLHELVKKIFAKDPYI